MLRRANTNKQLILKYAAGEPLTEPELSQFNALKAGLKYHQDLPDQLKDPNWVAKQLEERSRYPADEVWARVLEKIEEKKGPAIPWKRWALVACLLGAAAGIYLLTRPVVKQAPVTNVAKGALPVEGSGSDIGKTREPNKTQGSAILTLSNERQVMLDTVTGTGPLATTNNTMVSFGAGNRLSYQPVEKHQSGDEGAYHVFETGKHISSPYVLKLTDGSTVWVNAGSKVRYPVAFSGKEMRRVEVWGEAYFEVSRQAGTPFRVIVNGANVDVLGTRFNVNTLAGSAEGHITLIEGRVNVTSRKDARNHYLLHPLEQVRIGKDSSLQWSRITDTSRLTAWKKFQFDGKPFEQILREIAQWYRLKLPDLGGIREQPIGGLYSRDLAATTILGTIQTLEHNRIHFGLKGDSLLIRMSP
jgi:transmembrane sensor